MQTPGRAIYADYYGVVNHPVYGGGGDDRIAEIITKLLEVDVGGNDGRAFAVPAVDHFVKQAGDAGVMLFQPVEADFINE